LCSGREPAAEFYDALPPRDARRFRGLWRRTARYGSVANDDLYFKVKGSDNIYAFRIGKWWMFSFMDSERFVLLTGGAVITGRCPRSQIEKAENLRHEYLRGLKVKEFPAYRKGSAVQ